MKKKSNVAPVIGSRDHASTDRVCSCHWVAERAARSYGMSMLETRVVQAIFIRYSGGTVALLSGDQPECDRLTVARSAVSASCMRN